MPHLTVEISKNILSQINETKLLVKLHCSLEPCEGIDMSRVKSRVVHHEQVLNGKQAQEIQMIHITLAILQGRDQNTRSTYGKTLFQTLKDNLPQDLQTSTSLSVEIREMDKDTYTL